MIRVYISSEGAPLEFSEAPYQVLHLATKNKEELLEQIAMLKKVTLSSPAGLDIFMDALDLQPDRSYQAIIDKLDKLADNGAITMLGKNIGELKLDVIDKSFINYLEPELEKYLSLLKIPISLSVVAFKNTKVRFTHVRGDGENIKFASYEFFIGDKDVLRELSYKVRDTPQ